MAVVVLAVGVSNKVLVGFKVQANTHKIMLREIKSLNFIKYHFLQVAATWVAAVASAKVAVAVDLAKVAVAVDLAKAAAAVVSAKVAAAVVSAKVAVDSAKVVVDSAKVAADSARAVAVDLARAAAVVDLVAGAKVAAGAKRSV